MLGVRVIRRSRETRGSHDEASARIGQLDELRALAIAAVVLSHIAMAFGSRSRTAYWLNLPDLAVGVDLFFAVSGFVIAVSLRQMIDAKLKGEGIDITAPAEPADTNVVDLMAALKKSLSQESPKQPLRSPAPAKPKRAAAAAQAASPIRKRA